MYNHTKMMMYNAASVEKSQGSQTHIINKKKNEAGANEFVIKH